MRTCQLLVFSVSLTYDIDSNAKNIFHDTSVLKQQYAVGNLFKYAEGNQPKRKRILLQQNIFSIMLTTTVEKAFYYVRYIRISEVKPQIIIGWRIAQSRSESSTTFLLPCLPAKTLKTTLSILFFIIRATTLHYERKISLKTSC